MIFGSHWVFNLQKIALPTEERFFMYSGHFTGHTGIAFLQKEVIFHVQPEQQPEQQSALQAEQQPAEQPELQAEQQPELQADQQPLSWVGVFIKSSLPVLSFLMFYRPNQGRIKHG